MQSAHHVAQKLTSTTLPRRSEVENCSPESVAKRTSGAADPIESESAAATPAARAMTATRSIFAFMRLSIVTVFAVAVMTGSLPAMARLEDLTSREAIAGLKTALEKGSQSAIAS